MQRKILLFMGLILSQLTCSAQRYNYSSYTNGGSANGVVGKIADEFNVTPLGQANYNMVIPVPEGTGGVCPKLSISYSSTNGNGLFGYGFDLSGLSVIARVPSNIYHDGKAGFVKTAESYFAIDGVRLLTETYYNSDSVRYITENNNFSKVMAYGTPTDPKSFIVHTKEGLIYEYTSDTQLRNTSGNSLFWYLTKVSDTAGNYFTVKYNSTVNENEVYPVRVDYTGNSKSGLEPYASVRLEYGYYNRPHTTYIYGNVIKRSRRIHTIKIYYDESLIRQYETNYSDDRLLSVTESANNGKKKNPTVFTWDKICNSNVSKVDYNTTSYISNAVLTVGDFNGDGKADFVATPKDNNASWKNFRIFISNGSGFTLANNSSIALEGDVKQVVTGDFNGDGLDDIAVLILYNKKYYNTWLYFTNVSGNNVTLTKSSTASLSLSQEYNIHALEVNGDGVADLFAWIEGTKTCHILRSVFSGNAITPLGYDAIRFCDRNWSRVEYVDVNGDGLTDVMNLDDSGYSIMLCDGFGTYSEMKTGKWPNKNHIISYADINGDGKTDMMLTGYNDTEWSQWVNLYSDGTGVFIKNGENYFTRKFDARKTNIYIADINGDGYDDFYAIDKTNSSDNMVPVNAYINDGTGSFTLQASNGYAYPSDKWNFYFGDFNGDGRNDIVCTANWDKTTWSGCQLYVATQGNDNLVSKITDGMGCSTSIGYKKMTDKSVHTKGTTNLYPMTSFVSSWSVVSDVTTPNGIGGTNVIEYTYSNALVHKQGRGILGFEKVTKYDQTNGTTTISEYDVNTDYYIPGLKHTETTLGSTLLAETDITNFYLPYSKYSKSVTCLPKETISMEYEYNSKSIVSQCTVTNEYDSYGNITKTTSNNGSTIITTTNAYSNDLSKWILGRLQTSQVIKSKAGISEMINSSFTYDTSTGLLASESLLPDDMQLGYTKTYSRDIFGNIISSTTTAQNTNFNPRTTISQYDIKGRFMTCQTNSLGHKSTNNVMPSTGWLLSSTDANGIVTSNTYDSFGNIVQNTTPLSTTYIVTGWSNGMNDAPVNAVYFTYSETSGAAFILKFYDLLGREIRNVTEVGNCKLVYQDIVYDAKGQKEKVSDPYFPGTQTVQWHIISYDDVGRISHQQDTSGATTSYSYSGNTTTCTDPLGHDSSKTVDVNGNLISVTDAAGTVVTYEYDASGHCTQVKGPRTTIKMKYDCLGNRTFLDDPDMGTTEYVYNAYGEIIMKTDSHGETRYSYDGGGRLEQEEGPDQAAVYQYDTLLKGMLTSVESNNGMTKKYTYDAYGRVIEEQQITSDETFTTDYSYDNKNRIATIAYPSGVVVSNTYSDCGTLIAVSDNDTGKKLWHLGNVNAKGQITEEVAGNNIKTYSSYLSNGCVSEIDIYGKCHFSYSYDKCYNLISRRDEKRELTECFAYDDLNRLIKVRALDDVDNPFNEINIEYDAAGNITYKTGVGNISYIDGTNRISSVSGGEYTLPLWDEIKYTSFNKICSASYSASTGRSVYKKTLNIEYGPDKQRWRQTTSSFMRMATYRPKTSTPNSIINYYVGKLYEKTLRNDTITEKSYIFANGKVVALIEGVSPNDESQAESKVVFVHHDNLGSVLCYTDENGNIVEEYSYDAWGRRRNADTWEYDEKLSNVDDYGFTGHEHIDLFDMINMDGRMYDPHLGRFLSPDPYVQAPELSQSLNRYAYCLNNPLSLIDPSGYSWLSNNWKSLVGAAVGIAVSIATMGSSTALSMAIVAGAAGGAAGALTGALLNGSNIGQIAKSTLVGGLIGAASGFLNFASSDEELFASLFKHSFSDAFLEGIQGGNMLHGAISGLVSCGGGSLITEYGSSLGDVGKVAANAILGGTVSEIGGGKFANGAVTAAFAMMFNDLMHDGPTYKQIEKIFNNYVSDKTGVDFYKSLGGEIAADAVANPELYENTCAAKLSDAMNKAGLKIPYIPGQTSKGANGNNYFLRAVDMKAYFVRKWGIPRNYNRSHSTLRNCIVYQNGFGGGVSGHVDVFYKGNSGGGAYAYFTNLYGQHPNITTVAWKSGM